MFIIIIEDGYLTIKYKEPYDWLQKKYSGNLEKETGESKGKIPTTYEEELNMKLTDRFEGIDEREAFI